jgi:hypothetical protein
MPWKPDDVLPPSGYDRKPLTANKAVMLGQGGDAPGNIVFPRYSDNDADDPDTQRLQNSSGAMDIEDPYEAYGQK